MFKEAIGSIVPSGGKKNPLKENSSFSFKQNDPPFIFLHLDPFINITSHVISLTFTAQLTSSKDVCHPLSAERGVNPEESEKSLRAQSRDQNSWAEPKLY